jgi:ketosteroid isomerase-like protein
MTMRIPNDAVIGRSGVFGWLFTTVFTLLCVACSNKVDDSKAATDSIRSQIAKYTAALDAANINLAAEVWRTSADISFIHPAGHAHGWEEVKGFYNFFGSAFSERKLTLRDEVIHVNGNSAWAEFYWHFIAKGKDGSMVETDGRETQIYENSGTGWQLVHVHYSGPPLTPQ